MKIKFGPAGLGPVKEAEERLEEYSRVGLEACEIAFTYGIYIKKKEDAERIGRKAKELGIELSIHAPYWLNLNSSEKKKIEDTKKRIIDCCELAYWLGAKRVIFHPGYYGKDKDKAYTNIRDGIKEMTKIVENKKWNVELCPETMGKVNVFGSVEEISNLVKDTGCSFCIDFAHILARDKEVDFKKIEKLFPAKKWHCHFSGIVYGEKGEKHHKKTEKKEWKNLIDNLPNKEFVIINESPDPVNDSIVGLEIFS